MIAFILVIQTPETFPCPGHEVLYGQVPGGVSRTAASHPVRKQSSILNTRDSGGSDEGGEPTERNRLPTQPSPRANTRFTSRSCQHIPGDSSAWEHMQRAQVQRKPMGCRQTVCHRRFLLSSSLRSTIAHPLPGLWALTRSRRPGASGPYPRAGGGAGRGRGRGSDTMRTLLGSLPPLCGLHGAPRSWQRGRSQQQDPSNIVRGAPRRAHPERTPSGQSRSAVHNSLGAH